jgi:myo-inositol-1(or 4)-monophosphatase
MNDPSAVMWNEVVFSLAKDVEKAVMPIFGKPEAGKTVGTNVSGDVTKYVDKVAEEMVLERLNVLGINAFSFALFRKEKPVYAALYEFATGNYYEAIPGNGAFLNGRPIKVQRVPASRAAISFYTRGRGVGLIGRVKRIRVLGAIAVELAYLARGTLQGVVDIRNYVRPTDVAAGVVLVREAGGVVVDDTGKEVSVHLSAEEKMNLIAASDRELLEIILEEVNGGGR